MDNVVIVENCGLKFSCSSELEVYRAETLLTKEGETIEWISTWSNSSKVFFDVGANIGGYSIYAAKSYPALTVFAFEPSLTNFSALHQNAMMNGLSNLNAFQIGICESKKLVPLVVKDLRVGASGAQLVSQHNSEFRASDAVIAMSIDILVREFDFPFPNYIKVDVDGLEPKILEGAKSVLSDNRLEGLLVEFNDLDEANYWKTQLEMEGLVVDLRFDNNPYHSNIRRIEKGSNMRNIIFRRNK